MVGRPASRSPFPVDRLDLPMPCSTEPAAGRRRIANTEHAHWPAGDMGGGVVLLVPAAGVPRC
jgi:hypothetical protein